MALTREVTPAPLLREKPDSQTWDWVAQGLWSSSQVSVCVGVGVYEMCLGVCVRRLGVS